MALIVLDSSVVIALLDASDTLHASAVSSFLECAGEDLRLPASAYAECLVGPARMRLLARARNRITQLRLTVEPLTARIAERAAELRARTRVLGLSDALVIATGDTLRANRVLTGDAVWSQLSSRVRVIRP